MFTEESLRLNPIHFFQISTTIHYVQGFKKFPHFGATNVSKKYLLPSLSELNGEEDFAKVILGWHGEGLEFLFELDDAFDDVSYPDFRKGDSIEICLDTRDVKTAGFPTGFCHHFFFLSQNDKGPLGKEITHFRTDDRHTLCAPEELKVISHIKPNSCKMHLLIPNHCLHGYDPDQFNRLGFTYRINRAKGPSQNFSVDTTNYVMEHQPSLWSSLKLSK